MDIVQTGICAPTKCLHKRLHKVLRPEYKLQLGSACHDGRPITESWRYIEAKRLGIPILMKRPAIVPRHEKKELLVDKYTPTSIEDIIGHKDAIQQIQQWLSSWTTKSKGILLTGPPGIGKTSMIHCIAAAMEYKVTEYNASDSRSISTLKGLISLGMKRLQKEVVVMDEIDGLSERGGVGEIADLIRKSLSPIICIANECPPKLKPIVNACLHIKCSRPNKSTIASAVLSIATKEQIAITKIDLEKLCEENGNDIRSILNRLEFYRDGTMSADSNKDATLRLDLFSATQKLMGNKHIPLAAAEDLVYVDYFMVPLMVQEAYVAAAKGSLDDIVAASEFISDGDIIQRRIMKTQDWSLLPHVVQTTVSAARTVRGPAPFQIFPQLLGKNSKKMKHMRLIEDLSRRQRHSSKTMRLDCAEWMNKILLTPLKAEKPDIKGTIQRMLEMKITRDDIVESVGDVLFTPIDLSTKTKTAFTREYNKIVSVDIKKRKRVLELESESESDEEVTELEEEMELLGL